MTGTIRHRPLRAAAGVLAGAALALAPLVLAATLPMAEETAVAIALLALVAGPPLAVAGGLAAVLLNARPAAPG